MAGPLRSAPRILSVLFLGLASGFPASGWAGTGSAGTGSDSAEELLQKGWQQFHMHMPAHYATVLQLFHQAKEADPDNSEADAALAALYWRSYEEFWFHVLGAGRSDAPRLAKIHLEAAMEAPTARAQEVDCRMKSFRAKHDEALAACEKAIALAPADADIRHAMALALINDGQPEEALSQVREARRIEPGMEEYHGYYEGMARFFSGDSAGAIAALEEAIKANPALWTFEEDYKSAICNPCILLIAALAEVGREDEAKRLVEKFLVHHSGWTVASEMYFRPLRRKNDIERLANALRAAGVPE